MRIKVFDDWNKPLCSTCLSRIAGPYSMGVSVQDPRRYIEVEADKAEKVTDYLRSGSCVRELHLLFETEEQVKLALALNKAREAYEEIRNRPDGWSME